MTLKQILLRKEKNAWLKKILEGVREDEKPQNDERQ
jgi:hypothetical protein